MFGKSYGIPVLKAPPWFSGQLGIPGSGNPYGFRQQPQGLVWYVDGSHASANDTNEGTDPEAPLATIQAAITKNNATIDWAATPPYFGMNTIIVSPGEYAEALTCPYYCRVVGLGMATGNTTDICVDVHPAAGSAMAGTGLGLHLYNMRFTTDTAVPVLDFDVMNSCVIEDCMITDGNPGLATNGITTTDANSSVIVGCRFTGNTNSLTNGIVSTGDFFACQVLGCQIMATTVGIDLSGAALCGNTLIAHNYVFAGTVGIDDSVVGTTMVVDNWINATDAISHGNAQLTIANHVMNGAVGAVETTGTD